MKFNSNTGQELRTWILFFVGIALALIFALKGNPLNPWWTIVIGAFTCTAVIISAVQAIAGGIQDASKKTLDETRAKNTNTNARDGDTPLFSVALGFGYLGVVRSIFRRNPYGVCQTFG